jgi:hypothetical protein
MEQWRKFIKEEGGEEFSGDFKNVGELRAALKAIDRSKAGKVAMKSLSGAASGATDVLSAGAWPIIKALWDKGQKDPKLAKSNPILNKLMVDPFVSMVVDDDVEIEFLKDLSAMIDDKEDSDRLEDMDMTNLLSKYIRKDYANVLVRPPEE